jgi:dipeptidyl aminopeptidase/acylaminoacyl peptidase
VTALLLALLVMAGMALVPDAAAEGAGSDGSIVFQTVSGGPIYAVSGDGGNLRYLTTGMDPALSPDGQWVAFTRWDTPQHGAAGSLWVMNIDGTGERVVLEDVRQPKSPVWSPDGSRIAISMQEGGRLTPEHKCSKGLPSDPLVADRDGDYFRVVVEADGGDVEVDFCYTLLAHPYWGLRMVDVATGEYQDLPRDIFSHAPTWDPANDWRLVYDGELGLVNLDLNQNTTWALTNDVNDHGPVFSPDGSQVAVSYWQHDHWEIHVLNADGSGRVQVTKTPLRAIVDQRINGGEGRAWNNVSPTWSPDGKQIAFLTDRTGEWEIWVMRSDGSDQRPLLSEDTQAQLDLQYYGVNERVISWGE